MRMHTLLLAALLAWAPSALAQQGVAVFEDAYEVQAKDVQLPDQIGRSLYVTPCSGCAPEAFELDERTVFFHGQNTVSLPEFRELLRANPRAGVYVFFRIGGKDVTRMVISTNVLPSAAPASADAGSGQGMGGRRAPRLRSGS